MSALLTLPETAPPQAVSAPGLLRRMIALAVRHELAGAGLSVADQAIVSGTNFVTSVIIGRLAGADDLGIYSLGMSVVFLARGVQDQLVTAPYQVRCQTRSGLRRAAYLGSTLTHHIALSLLVVLAFIGLAAAVRLGVGPVGLKSVVWVLAAAAPTLLLREFLRQIAFAHLKPGLACTLDAVVAVTQVGGMLALAYSGLLTVGGAIGISAGGCLLAALAWFCLKPERVRVVPGHLWRDWTENWDFGRWALASQLVGGAGLYLLPWVVALVDGIQETGLLAAGWTLVGVANAFVVGLASYLSPRAARAYAVGGVAALRSVLWMTAGLFSLSLGLFSVGAIVAGSLAAGLIYGDQFADAGPIVAVLAVTLWINSMAITAGNGLWAVGRPEANFKADMASLGVSAIVTVALVPSFGATGAAVALLAAGTADTLMRLHILRRILKDIDAAEGAAQ